MIKLMQITIVHPWSKERCSVEVIRVTNTAVTFRWPLSGSYVLNLSTNTIVAASVKARHKNGPHTLWAADDIVAVRQAAKLHVSGTYDKAELAERMARHEATKPS